MHSGYVYLLHFDRPISPAHTTQHYVGWTTDLDERIAEHRAGRGARLTQVAAERGISFEVATWWIGDRSFERYLKRLKASPRLCPLCGREHRRRTIELHYRQLAINFDSDWPEPAPARSGFDRWEAMHFATRVPGGLVVPPADVMLPPDELPY